MSNTAELAKAQHQLDAINARIEAHALNAEPMKSARAVTAEHRDAGRDAVEQALAERGLPGAAEQGKALLLGLASLARLNRKRIRQEGRVTRLHSAQG